MGKRFNRSDLAISRHLNSELERLEARHFVNRNLNGSISLLLYRSFLGNLFNHRLFNHDAMSGSSLLDRIVHSSRGQRRASLAVELSILKVLTNQSSQSFLGQNVCTEARGLIVSSHRSGSNCAVLHSNVDRELFEALHGIRISRNLRASLLERRIDGLAGQRRAGLDVDLRTGDILTNQSLKDGGICDQVSAEARRLVVLENLHRSNLASVIHSNFHLQRTKAGHVIGIGRDNRLSRSASSSSGSRKNSFLIARVRSNAEGILRIGKNLGHSADKSGGRNRRAAKGIDVIIQRVRISSDRNELILELRLANAAAQTSSLLQRANVNLRHMASGAHAQRDRDRSAVALRVGNERVASDFAGGLVGTNKHLSDLAVFSKTLDFNNLFVLAAREHLIERFLLSGELLLSDRTLGHFVGDSQADSRNQREDEKTNSELNDITHSSLPPQSS